MSDQPSRSAPLVTILTVMAGFALFRARRVVQRKPDTDPAKSSSLSVLDLSGGKANSISLARSTPVESAVLSDRWQCTRTAGVLTVCTKKPG